MQNQQLVPNQTTLQQSSNSLQQNNNSLQQSGTPSGATDNSMILNQPLSADLQVQSAQTDPSLQSTYVPDQNGYGWLLAGLMLLAIATAYIIWKLLPTTPERITETVPGAEVPVTSSPKPVNKKALKKPKYQKKTTRRQRTRKP